MSESRGLPRRGPAMLALAVAFTATFTAEAEPLPIRVLSFNTWGIPVVAPDLEARFEQLAPAIAALAPDVVALQEVWMEADAERLGEALRGVGLPYQHWLGSSTAGGYRSTGMLIASVFPLRDAEFVPYEMGTVPHTAWHLDWYGAKGAMRVRLGTPVGDVDFVGTHFQADYDFGDYVPVRIGQALDLGALIGPPLHDGAQPPLLLAGDLNATAGALELRTLQSLSGLSLTDRSFDLDTILYRPGSSLGVRARNVRRVLEDEIRLRDGSLSRLSDHAGVLVDFDLYECTDCASERGPSWQQVGPEVVGALRREVDRARSQILAAKLAASGLGLLLAGWLYARRRPQWRRLTWSLAALATSVGAIWLGYIGFGYGPAYLSQLERAARMAHRDAPDPATQRRPAAPTP